MARLGMSSLDERCEPYASAEEMGFDEGCVDGWTQASRNALWDPTEAKIAVLSVCEALLNGILNISASIPPLLAVYNSHLVISLLRMHHRRLVWHQHYTSSTAFNRVKSSQILISVTLFTPMLLLTKRMLSKYPRFKVGSFRCLHNRYPLPNVAYSMCP